MSNVKDMSFKALVDELDTLSSSIGRYAVEGTYEIQRSDVEPRINEIKKELNRRYRSRCQSRR